MNFQTTQLGLPPVTVHGKEYSIGRIVRFLVGIALLFHAAIFSKDVLWFRAAEGAVALLLVDVKLFNVLSDAWKSRNG